MLSTRHQFLFIHIPKTAGNTVQSILRDYSEDMIVCHDGQDGVDRFEVRSEVFDTRKHSDLIAYRQQYGEDLYHRLFKFACVRNPWQRAVSFYFSPHRGRYVWDREEFIRLVNRMKPVAHFLSLDQDKVQPLARAVRNVDFLMRFETLEQDFGAVCDRIGIDAQPLPVRNRSSREAYQGYYDDETRRLVAVRFREEIELFGYRFHEQDAQGTTDLEPVGLRMLR